MDRFLLHSLVLLWASVGVARRLVPGGSDRVLAAALLAWGNLVVTSLLLAAIQRLDHAAWFAGTSAGLMLVAAAVARWGPAAADEPGGGKASPWLVGLFVATIAPLAVGSVVAAYFYAPTHYAAGSFGLPRVITSPGDPGQVLACGNYPFVQAFGLTGGPALPGLDFSSLAAWAVAGVAGYRLARLAAFSANVALAFAWIVLLVPAVLAQASVSVPDLPAGAALLVAAVFALRWKQARRTSDKLLAGFAALLALFILGLDLIPKKLVLSERALPSVSPGNGAVFAFDLVRSPANPATVSDSLLPAEGPFPTRDLPSLRLARKAVTEIHFPPMPGVKRIELTFSARLQARPRAGLEVRFNGEVVHQSLISSPTAWLDRSLELTLQAGENVLEFRDVPLPAEPNWLDYLERYPDVRNAVIAQNEELEAGARKHYVLAGRPEGRTVQLQPAPAEPPYYFMFRQLSVEGFQ